VIQPLQTSRLRVEPITPTSRATPAEGSTELGDISAPACRGNGGRSNLRLLTARLNAPERAIIIHREDQRVMATSGSSQMRGSLRTYELGYSIASEYRRQGIATEAAGAVLDWLFEKARPSVSSRL